MNDPGNDIEDDRLVLVIRLARLYRQFAARALVLRIGVGLA
jgi:hypothetical protein